jgi:hypothetical protein
LIHYHGYWAIFDVDSKEYEEFCRVVMDDQFDYKPRALKVAQPGRKWVHQMELPLPLIGGKGSHLGNVEVRVPYSWEELNAHISERFVKDSWSKAMYTGRDLAYTSKKVNKAGFDGGSLTVYHNASHEVIIICFDIDSVPPAARVDPLLYQCVWIFRHRAKCIRLREVRHYVGVQKLASDALYFSLHRDVLVEKDWSIATLRPQALVILNEGCPADIPLWYDADFRKLPRAMSCLSDSHGAVVAGNPIRVTPVETNTLPDHDSVTFGFVREWIKDRPPVPLQYGLEGAMFVRIREEAVDLPRERRMAAASYWSVGPGFEDPAHPLDVDN